MKEPITWRDFRPSIRHFHYNTWLKAKGVSLREELFPHKCSICERYPTNLLPFWEGSQMLYICSDHGGHWFDCRIGAIVIQSTMPYWKRRWRNRLLTLKIWLKYFWYLISDFFLLYIYWPIRYWRY